MLKNAPEPAEGYKPENTEYNFFSSIFVCSETYLPKICSGMYPSVGSGAFICRHSHHVLCFSERIFISNDENVHKRMNIDAHARHIHNLL